MAGYSAIPSKCLRLECLTTTSFESEIEVAQSPSFFLFSSLTHYMNIVNLFASVLRHLLQVGCLVVQSYQLETLSDYQKSTFFLSDNFANRTSSDSPP